MRKINAGALSFKLNQLKADNTKFENVAKDKVKSKKFKKVIKEVLGDVENKKIDSEKIEEDKRLKDEIENIVDDILKLLNGDFSSKELSEKLNDSKALDRLINKLSKFFKGHKNIRDKIDNIKFKAKNDDKKLAELSENEDGKYDLILKVPEETLQKLNKDLKIPVDLNNETLDKLMDKLRVIQQNDKTNIVRNKNEFKLKTSDGELKMKLSAKEKEVLSQALKELKDSSGEIKSTNKKSIDSLLEKIDHISREIVKDGKFHIDSKNKTKEFKNIFVQLNQTNNKENKQKTDQNINLANNKVNDEEYNSDNQKVNKMKLNDNKLENNNTDKTMDLKGNTPKNTQKNLGTGKFKNLVNKSNILKQIDDKAEVKKLTAKNQIEIKLKPDSLGKMKIQLSTESSKLVGKIIVENSAVRNFLENNINELKNNLMSKGLNIEHFNIETENKTSDNTHYNQNQNSGFDQFNQQENQSRNQNNRENIYETLNGYENLDMIPDDESVEGINNRSNYQGGFEYFA